MRKVRNSGEQHTLDNQCLAGGGGGCARQSSSANFLSARYLGQRDATAISVFL